MRRVSATEVMIEHNSKLARDPAHLRRLVAFWPEENIVHQLAKNALADMDRYGMITDSAPLITDKPALMTDNVPHGWVLVPIVPTEKMMLNRSGCQSHDWNDYSCPMRESRRLIWKHMVEAANEVAK